MNSSLKTIWVLMALLLPALLVGLGNRPVFKVQEVRVAETAREMLESGDWIVPRYNGELRLQKPPLPYWATATSYQVLGINEVTTRLPSVLFGLLAAGLVWLWSRREIGVMAAANAAMILVTTYIGLRYFRSGEADAILLFFVSAACLLGYGISQGQRNNSRKLLFALALGMGFLSKGPAGLAIPLLAVSLMAVLENRMGRVRSSVKDYVNWSSILLLIISAFGWYVWILWSQPEIAQQFFGRQVDETFVRGTHAKPVWWYAAHWFEFFAPWGLLSIPAAWLAWKTRLADAPPLVRFAWIWLAVVTILLTATVNKQMQYALLFAPPLAIILGHYLAQSQGRFLQVNTLLFWLFLALICLGVVIALRKSDNIPAALLWLAISLLPLLIHRFLKGATVSQPVLLVASLSAMAFLYSEAYFSKEPHKVAAQTLMAEAAQYEQLYQLRTPLNDGALSFHAGKVVPPVDTDELKTLIEKHPEVWVVGEKPLSMTDADVQVISKVDDLKLYRVRRVSPSSAPQ